MEILRACDLCFAYDYALFEDLNLKLNAGESSAILGVSGCGKSTLLHILSTLLAPNSGEVIYDGRSIYALSEAEKNEIRRKFFGIIFQSHYLFKGFSARENLQIASILSGQKLDDEILKRLKIDGVLQQKIGTLSGGQQQRLSIARVLSKRPRVIFADEPTGNLDKATADDVMGVLFDYVKQNSAALLLVTHDEGFAKMCDNIFTLQNGALVQI